MHRRNLSPAHTTITETLMRCHPTVQECMLPLPLLGGTVLFQSWASRPRITCSPHSPGVPTKSCGERSPKIHLNSARGVVRASEPLPSITTSDTLVPTPVWQQLPPTHGKTSGCISPLAAPPSPQGPLLPPQPLQTQGCGDLPVQISFSVSLD